MKKILICLFILASLNGYSQQSSISITPLNPTLLLVEDKGAEKVFHIEFVASDIANVSQVHIQIGTAESSADIVNQIFTISVNNGEYVLSDGTPVTDNTIRAKVSLNEEQFFKFNYCSAFIIDSGGLKSNTLTISK